MDSKDQFGGKKRVCVGSKDKVHVSLTDRIRSHIILGLMTFRPEAERGGRIRSLDTFQACLVEF